MKRNGLVLLLSGVIVLLGLVTGATAEEGVTATEIHIGQWGPQTGPAAAWGSVARGTDAYFKMINERGGIHGRKLIHHMFDDAYNPAKTKAGVKELQEGTGMFAWVSGVGTAPGLAVRDYLMDRQVPWVGPRPVLCTGSIRPSSTFLRSIPSTRWKPGRSAAMPWPIWGSKKLPSFTRMTTMGKMVSRVPKKNWPNTT